MLDKTKKREKFAVLSLVLSVVGLIFIFLKMAGYCWPMFFIGIGLGYPGLKTGKRKIAIAAIVLSIVSICITAFLMVCAMLFAGLPNQ